MTSVLFHSFRSSSVLHKFSKIVANDSRMSLFCSLSILKGICLSSAGLKIFCLRHGPVLYSLSLSLRLIILASCLRLTLLAKKSKKGINFFDIISNHIFSPLSTRSLFPLSLSCYKYLTGIAIFFCIAIYSILTFPIMPFFFTFFYSSVALLSLIYLEKPSYCHFARWDFLKCISYFVPSIRADCVIFFL